MAQRPPSPPGPSSPAGPAGAGHRATVVLVIGTFAYAVSVWQRTSLGVAGLDAAQRFDAQAGVVATFAVLQLLVYAAAQVPVGVLLDAFGSRAMVTAGALTMAVGEVAMAMADNVWEAGLARILVGAGDAMTFSCVIRLLPAWFPPRRVPILTQVVSLVGQTGQVASAVPFAAILHGAGWQPAFLVCAAACLVSAVLAGALLRDAPGPRRPHRSPISGHQLRQDVVTVWRAPGTRLALWTHWSTGFAPIVFAMMWGFPYLVSGEGLSGPTASSMITLFVAAGILFGPTVGTLTQRHPYRRTNLAMMVGLLNMLPWLLIVLWPGPAPYWLLALLVVCLSSGGPGSAIGLDLGRSFTEPRRLGTATGIVIMGAFTAALVNILLIGVVLDVTGGAPYSLRQFRLAMATQLLFFVIGLVGMYRSRRVVRERMRRSGVVLDPFPEAVRRKARSVLRRPRGS